MKLKIFCRCSLFPSWWAKDLSAPLYDHGESPILCYSQGCGGYRRQRNREQCRKTDLQGDTF